MTARIKRDRAMMEIFSYTDPDFPFEVWTDNYDLIIDSTLLCHWHDSIEISCVLKGNIDYYVNGEHLPMKEGDVVFANALALHMARQKRNCSGGVMSVLTFRPDIFSGTKSEVYKKFLQPVISSNISGMKMDPDSPNGKKAAELMNKLHELNKDTKNYELLALAYGFELWYSIIGSFNSQGSVMVRKENPKVKTDSTMKGLMSYIHEHYRDDISLSDLTEFSHLSRSGCFRNFRKYTGRTPLEFLNEYRLSQAAAQLVETDLPVTDIAMSCGFSSSSYFSELFKRKYKVTPLNYRKS
jgi:AraC-like DNA-binding protein